MPGVVAVMTGAELVAAGVKHIPGSRDFKRAGGEPGATPLRRVLAHERVRFVGEAVALVVAETLQQARDAAEAVAVEYEELPQVTDPVAATAAGRSRDVRRSAGQHRRRNGPMATAAAAAAAFGQAPMWSSCTSTTSGWPPCDRATLGAGLDRRTTDA